MMGTIQKSIGATERLMDILENEVEDIATSADLKLLELAGDITFEAVSFEYETRQDVNVLKDVSFSIQSGQTLAIVGPSGAGKSTITSLLFRFYEPTSGAILLDGKALSNYELTALRRQMAIVPQDVQLFAGTIRENIAYGRPDASFEEIKKAAEQANAMEFIQQFPDGFDSLVGDRGNSIVRRSKTTYCYCQSDFKESDYSCFGRSHQFTRF
jgi:ABC-type multidrug transport system fused ATPase/permease subunit